MLQFRVTHVHWTTTKVHNVVRQFPGGISTTQNECATHLNTLAVMETRIILQRNKIAKNIATLKVWKMLLQYIFTEIKPGQNNYLLICIPGCPEGGEIYTDVAGNQRTCTSNDECPNTHFCTEINKWTNGAWKSVNYCCPNRRNFERVYVLVALFCISLTL